MNAPAANSLCELVEQLGSQVDSGALPEADAVRMVFEFSEGGVTRVGAAGLLKDWKTLRATLRQQIADTKAALARLDGVS